MTSKWVPKSDTTLGEAGAKVLVGSFIAQTVFVIEKWAPSAPKVLPMIEK